MQEGPSRSGKCGADPIVPRARPRPDAGASGPGLSVIIAAISLTGVLANTMVAPALPDIARALDVGDSGIGLVVAAASLPGVAIAPVIGFAADRFGRRAVVLPCLVVFGLGGLAAMAAQSFAFLLAARFVQGFGAAGLVNLAVVMIGDQHEDPARRAAAIGRNGAVLTVGLAVLPAVGGGVVALGGWRASFGFYGVAFVVAAAAARVLPGGRPPGVVRLGDQARATGTYLRDRRVIAMTSVGFVGFVLVFGLVLTALPSDLHSRFGAGPGLRGVMLGLPAAAAAGISLTMGPLTRRWRTWDLVLGGFAILSLTFLGVAASPSVLLVGLSVVVYGVGEALIIVSLQAYAAGLAPAAYRGVMVAVWVSAVRGGQALGPVLAGLCIDHIGTRGTFVAGAGVAAATTAAVMWIRVRVAPPLERPDRVRLSPMETSDPDTT